MNPRKKGRTFPYGMIGIARSIAPRYYRISSAVGGGSSGVVIEGTVATCYVSNVYI